MDSTKSQASKGPGALKWHRIILVVVAIVLLLPAIFLGIKHAIFTHYIGIIAERTSLDNDLIKVLAALLLAPFFIGFRYALSIRRRKRRIGYAILITLYAGFYLGLYFATRGAVFSEPHWYVITYDCEVRYFDRPGVDLETGQSRQPVTGEVIRYLQLVKRHGCDPIDPHTAEFFNKVTEQPQVYYIRYPDGEYKFYYAQVTDRYGNRSRPVTKEVIKEWEASIKTEEAQRRDGGDQRVNAERRARERAENEQRRRNEEAYRRQYVNTSILSQLRGEGQVALVASRPSSLSDARFVSLLRDRGVDAHTGIFKEATLRSDMIQRLSIGDEEVLKRLGLTGLSGFLILHDLSFGDLVDTGRLVRTHAYLSVTVIPLSGDEVISREFSARGAGFDAASAENQAATRVLDDFVTDSVIASMLGAR